MPGNTFGTTFRITSFGESHGAAVGVVVDGCPAGLELSEEDIQKELDRRKPGQSEIVSPRGELDKAEILSGVFEGKTLGSPIAIMTRNKDADRTAYSYLKDVYRPGHADFTWEKKYGIRDWSGGGRASARETWARVAAGAIAKKILAKEGVQTTGYVKQVGDIIARNINLADVEKTPVRCPDLVIAQKMIELIESVKEQGDSIGGVVEIVVKNTPVGLGEPVFDKLTADLAKGLLSLPATKGIEFGEGFHAAAMQGSAHNDVFEKTDEKVAPKTNRAGGVLGGISTGEDITIRVVVKPASSIPKTQSTVDKEGNQQDIQVTGRHDPCLCPRAVPIMEAMVNLVLCDHYLRLRHAKL